MVLISVALLFNTRNIDGYVCENQNIRFGPNAVTFSSESCSPLHMRLGSSKVRI